MALAALVFYGMIHNVVGRKSACLIHISCHLTYTVKQKPVIINSLSSIMTTGLIGSSPFLD
jgi:hypothetical protein